MTCTKMTDSTLGLGIMLSYFQYGWPFASTLSNI